MDSGIESTESSNESINNDKLDREMRLENENLSAIGATYLLQMPKPSQNLNQNDKVLFRLHTADVTDSALRNGDDLLEDTSNENERISDLSTSSPSTSDFLFAMPHPVKDFQVLAKSFEKFVIIKVAIGNSKVTIL